jgi:hypothetical protein
VKINNVLTFSSSLRRSTPDKPGGKWWIFDTASNLKILLE